MNLKKLAYFIFAVSLFVFLFSFLNFFFGERILQTDFFYTSVTVGDRAGFDLNKTALTFGETSPGGSSSRELRVENGFPFKVVAKIICGGTICKILNFKKSYDLEKQEKKEIQFLVVVNNDTKQGFYDGNIKVELRRRNSLL